MSVSVNSTLGADGIILSVAQINRRGKRARLVKHIARRFNLQQSAFGERDDLRIANVAPVD